MAGQWVERGSFKGPEGDSAYEIWLAAGNTGTESDYLAAIKGEPGLDATDAAQDDAALEGFILTDGTKTKAALSSTYVRGGNKGLFVDVTAPPYNAKGDGTTDDYAVIDGVATSLETFGGGTVFMPYGNYRTSAHLRPRNFVRYQGVGIGRTVIKPYKSAAFTGHGTLEAPIESPEWFDMTWDGADIVSTNSLKGQFSEFLRNAHWERVHCTNFTATGFGSDFLPGGRYINCIASGNGRGQAVHDPGMSGIGIGTGKYEVEDILVQGCIAFGNTNYGIFVEKQGSNTNAPYYSKGVRIVNNYTYGNAWGIGGCGVEAPVYSGNISHGNTYDGITLHEGTGLAPLGQPDKRAIITGNQCYNNGRDGINIDYEKNSVSANGAYHIIDVNECYGNTRDGLRIVSSKWASDVVRGIKIGAGNRFDKNGGEGVNIVKAAGAEVGVHVDDMHIDGFDTSGNGLNGIRIGVDMTRPVLTGIKAYDDQASRTQDYGIYIDVGTVLTDATIKGNELQRNQVGAAFWDLVANFAGWTEVSGNRGYYPGWKSVTLPGASPLTYTAGHTPEIFYFHGKPTDIKVKPRSAGGYVTIGVDAAASVLSMTTLRLEPGDSVQIAYTGSVSSVKTILQ